MEWWSDGVVGTGDNYNSLVCGNPFENIASSLFCGYSENDVQIALVRSSYDY
jgi:hypothetical protein